MNVTEKIETERLCLRKTQVEDASDVFHHYAQDHEVTKYLLWRPHSSIEVTQEFLKSREELWGQKLEFTWSIVLKETQKVIGMISLRNNGYKVGVGYVLSRPYWGKGLMSEAAQAVVNQAKLNEEVRRIWAFCDSENPSSGRVLEKIGLKKEATIRNWVIHPNVSDQPRDCIFYSMNR